MNEIHAESRKFDIKQDRYEQAALQIYAIIRDTQCTTNRSFESIQTQTR